MAAEGVLLVFLVEASGVFRVVWRVDCGVEFGGGQAVPSHY